MAMSELKRTENSVLEGKEDVRIGVPRHFTKAGSDPFDSVELEMRTALIPGKDGPSFEQRDVEFPTFWSQTATNIVAQKYFRGKLNSPEREHSVRQMIGRVADTITAWGRKDSYFADGDEAETFRAELTHLLLHQMAAFNSPVWFNVGFEEHPQCSACQPYRALVSTPAGMVPIGELVDGDQVGREVYDSQGNHAHRGREGQRPQAGPADRAAQRQLRRGDGRSRGQGGPGARRAQPAVGARGPARAGNAHAPASPTGREVAQPALVPVGAACVCRLARQRRVRRPRPTPGDRRGGAGRLAAGRRLRRSVRGRHEPLADDRVPGRHGRRVRLDLRATSTSVFPDVHRQCPRGGDRGRDPPVPADQSVRRGPAGVRRRLGPAGAGHRDPRSGQALDRHPRRGRRLPAEHLPGRRVCHRPARQRL